MIPSVWERKLSDRVAGASLLTPPCRCCWVTLIRSMGVGTPLAMASAASEARCVPKALHASALPLPQGTWATAIFCRARRASARAPNPLKHS